MAVVRLRFCSMLLTVALAAGASVYGGEFSLYGRASGWLGASRDSSYRALAGLRYLPEACFSTAIREQFRLDAEASVNGFVSADARPFDPPEVEARIKPYRGFVRLSATRFEARAGLQKINFGSAMLLRPLQWFDRIDPRDPLELTDGVYGLLGRYYFQNNANLWAWGLVGNSSPKGWEQIGSERWRPEFGGRAQLPVPRGEIGITGHHRTASVVWGDLPTLPPDTYPAEENRVGLDGTWDIGIGLWIEATAGNMRSSYVPHPWQRTATVGLDYTFGLGNGLTVLAEHLVLDNATEAFGSGQRMQVSAAMVSYPLGLLDNARGMVLYDWRNKGISSFLSWQRTLDNWLFQVAAFWNPDTPASLGATGGAAGKGMQLMVVFNH